MIIDILTNIMASILVYAVALLAIYLRTRIVTGSIPGRTHHRERDGRNT
jgi:hypothetical protein